MNKQKQTLILLIIILIVAALVWAIYLKGAKQDTTTQPVQPVVDDGKFTPKLNNTLETSVTVINPQDSLSE